MRRTLLPVLLGSILVALSHAEEGNRPWLGVRVEALVDAVGDEFLRIQHVTPMSPAALGGLEVDDLILGVGDADLVREADEELIAAFQRLLGDASAGDVVPLRIMRPRAGTGVIVMEITLGRRPPPRQLAELRLDLEKREPDWQPLWDHALASELDPAGASAAAALTAVIARSEYDPVPDPFRLEDVELAKRSPPTLACIARDLGNALTGDGLPPDPATLLSVIALHQGELRMLEMRRASSALAPPAEGQSAVEALVAHIAALAPLFETAQATCGRSAQERLRLAQGGTALVRLLASEAYLRADTTVPISPAHLRTLRTLLSVDRAALLLAASATIALRDFVLAVPAEDWKPGEYVSALGMVVIGTIQNDDYFRPAAVIIDPGGDDSYRKGSSAVTSERSPLALVVDLGAGRDTYAGNDRGLELGPAAAACGVAFLHDDGGDDTYTGGTGGCAAAVAGVAILEDMGGNDTYRIEQNGIGSAVAGAALLLDRAGNDTYVASRFAQGAAACGGFGALVDLAGDDTYRLQPGGDDAHAIAGGQGYGLGPMDPLAGVFLSGGLGILVDEAGDDEYTAGGHAMGCGVAYGMGILVDRGGDDTYHGGEWCLGTGVHAGVGAILEDEGNDRYELGVGGGLGWGADLGVGLAVDGFGDDVYSASGTSLGFAAESGLGVFLDLQGADSYSWVTPGLGGSKPHEQRPGSSLGVWIDAGFQPQHYSGDGVENAPGLPQLPPGQAPGLRWELPLGLVEAIEWLTH